MANTYKLERDIRTGGWTLTIQPGNEVIESALEGGLKPLIRIIKERDDWEGRQARVTLEDEAKAKANAAGSYCLLSCVWENSGGTVQRCSRCEL